jgi:hypothetical protein
LRSGTPDEALVNLAQEDTTHGVKDGLQIQEGLEHTSAALSRSFKDLTPSTAMPRLAVETHGSMIRCKGFDTAANILLVRWFMLRSS